ncbi:MAG: glycosyltransferase family 39 protein [Candidatus Omnitrophota bacterium]
MNSRVKEKSVSKIAARICLALGGIGLILTVIYVLLPDTVLLNLATRLALTIGDLERISFAGSERLHFELLKIIQKLKVVLLLVSGLFLVWGLLWKHLSAKAAGEVPVDVTISAGSKILPGVSSPLLLGMIIVAALIRLVNFNQSLWYDEIYSVLNFIDKGNFLNTVTAYAYFNNHILNSILARMAILVFGRAEWVFRLPAFIFGIISIGAMAKFSRLFGNKSIVWISTALLVFSALHVDQSQQSRGYTALLLFSILSCYFFLQALRKSKYSFWWGFVITTVLGLYAHLYMLMVLLSQLAVVLLGAFVFKENKNIDTPLVQFETANRFFLFTTIAGVVVFLFYLPVVPFIFFELLRDYVPKNINFTFLLSVIKTLGSGELIGSIIYLILFFTGLVFIWQKEKKIALLTITMFVIPFCLNLIIRPRYLYPRFFMFALPVYMVLVASGINSLSQKLPNLRPCFVKVICTIFLIVINLPAVYTVLSIERQDYRAAAEFIREIVKKDKDVIVIAPGVAGREIKYYLRHIDVVKVSTVAEVKELQRRYDRQIFFVTYDWSFEKELQDFIRDNANLQTVYYSRIPVRIYEL